MSVGIDVSMDGFKCNNKATAKSFIVVHASDPRSATKFASQRLGGVCTSIRLDLAL